MGFGARAQELLLAGYLNYGSGSTIARLGNLLALVGHRLIELLPHINRLTTLSYRLVNPLPDLRVVFCPLYLQIQSLRVSFTELTKV